MTLRLRSCQKGELPLNPMAAIRYLGCEEEIVFSGDPDGGTCVGPPHRFKGILPGTALDPRISSPVVGDTTFRRSLLVRGQASRTRGSLGPLGLIDDHQLARAPTGVAINAPLIDSFDSTDLDLATVGEVIDFQRASWIEDPR